MKRRVNGEGTIYKRKDGRWVAEFTYKKNGILKKKILYARKQQDVIQKKNSFLQAVEDEFLPTTAYTLKNWFFHWLKKYKLISLRAGTYDDYYRLITLYVSPILGNIPLSELTSDALQGVYNNLSKNGSMRKKNTGLSPRTIRYINSIMRGCLKKAVQNKLIRENVALYVEMPQNNKKNIEPLTIDEEKRLIEIIRDDRLECAILIALGCGVRIGEICALMWENVDLDNGIIKVRGTCDRIENTEYPSNTNKKTYLHFGAPKTNTSLRDVPIPSSILLKLQNLKDKQDKEIESLNIPYPKERFVFSSTVFTVTEPRTLTRKFKCKLKQAGIRETNFHVLRHTFTTRLLEQGVHMETLEELLGHSDKSITNNYAHASMELKKEAVQKIDFLFKTS